MYTEFARDVTSSCNVSEEINECERGDSALTPERLAYESERGDSAITPNTLLTPCSSEENNTLLHNTNCMVV